MEENILNSLSEVQNIKNVKGLVVGDENGIPLFVDGDAPKDSSGYVSSLASTAVQLNDVCCGTSNQQSNSPQPSILIETTGKRILIKQDRVTKTSIAIYLPK